jgi:polar amino acid transport system substrate-binding protein
MKRTHRLIYPLIAAALVLAACTPAATPTRGPAPTEVQAADDYLGTVMTRGTLIVSTDPAYPPQSELNPTGQRPAGTKCTADQKTAAELAGFDIDVAVAIAQGLGVEACFVTPAWDLITAGNWADRWDVSVGSMTVTPERMQVLYFAQPYYTTPAAVFVHQDNTSFTKPEDLSGKTVGVCAACTYEAFLNGTLQIPGETINFSVKGATVKGYDTDSTALEDLALGDGVRLDAVITAQPTGEGFIADGKPLKQLGDPVYFEYLAPAVDKAHSKDAASFVEKVSQIVQGLHNAGTLKSLSEKYYGSDLTTAAGQFDLGGLEQFP